MKNFPWIEKKISSIDLNNLSHALIVEGQEGVGKNQICQYLICLLYTSPSPRDRTRSRMPSSA